VELTELGVRAARSGLELKPQVTDVTDRMIQSGEWKGAEIRKYDVQTFGPPAVPAKKHPLTRLSAQVRRIFTDMGFEEMSSEYVQPAFWNLDILYTPQDHPARDLQDTFYLEHPSSIHIDDEDFVQKIKEIHENGGDTGSTGWGGEWSRERAEAALLRTHSTVSSVKYIAEHPDAPRKAFSISRIFRKESIDSTHLPEFTQIEGIVMDEHADFDMLITIIREFYARMGFDQIRIRPAYFPYTEPSLELEVFFNGKWMELGGAGIFRPEVLEPLGVKIPVLAWGFGFERLAMLKWNIKDIRELYISDLDVLRGNTVL
ncbi:MAG: phenylalanine--tRNA ligase subunit alpha, partial [Candidatus Methanomethylophilaceae archaeon]|nr:phenylalanine--tRNA ligase subunit alpha [Candidatus Methanomethylophilaceae archaeon]